RRSAGGVSHAQCAAVRLLYARDAADRAGPAGAARAAEPRGDPRAHIRQLLSLHRLPGDRRCGGSCRAITSKRTTTMNDHLKPLSVSEQADELEERMMHELERIVTKSTLHYLEDGEVKKDTSASAWAKNPKAIFNMGPDPRLPPMPEKPTLIDYFRCRFAE